MTAVVTIAETAMAMVETTSPSSVPGFTSAASVAYPENPDTSSAARTNDSPVDPASALIRTISGVSLDTSTPRASMTQRISSMASEASLPPRTLSNTRSRQSAA